MENTNITLDITSSMTEKHTLAFSKDDNGQITVTLDEKLIDAISCYRYLTILDNLSKLLYTHIIKIANS